MIHTWIKSGEELLCKAEFETKYYDKLYKLHYSLYFPLKVNGGHCDNYSKEKQYTTLGLINRIHDLCK